MAYYQDPNNGGQYGQQYDASGYPPPQGGYGAQGYASPPVQPDGYYNPAYSQSQPLSPSLGGEGGSPLLAASDSKAVMTIGHTDGLTKRDVFMHKNFDIDTLRDIEGLRSMKDPWQFRMETGLACWVMFNAVSTIMIILTNFRRTVDPKDRQAFGQTGFDVLMDFITYFPLVFFLIAILLFNNYYSEMTFYMYLRRGCIIDFPATADVKMLFRRVGSLVFLVTALAYLIIVIVAFIKFKASVGVILIFFNNLCVGVGMSWYRQQSIESKFVSISNFIQSFPDRNGEYGNMDEHSLHHASRFLQCLTLTESDDASYSAYMRLFYWRNRNYSAGWRIWHHCMLVVTIGIMAGLCVAYFIILRGLDEKSLWSNEINPCANACADATYNSTGLPLSDEQCSMCFCRCYWYLQQRDDSIFDSCSTYGGIGACGSRKVCPSEQVCQKGIPMWKNDD